jgi:group I intron endonuclease
MNDILKSYQGSPCIYQIKHKQTGKIYIGSTVNYRYRRVGHFSATSQCPKLQRAVQKYGKDSFEETILEYCNKELLIEREQYWLDTLLPFGKNGYNIAKNAISPTYGKKLSLKTRKKISDALKGNKYALGHKRSLETRAKISAANKGRIRTEIHRQRLREARKGFKHTEETKLKMSLAHKGKKISEEQKQKLRIANLGKKMSLEARLKMSLSHKNRKRKPHSEETKRKISETNRGRKRPPITEATREKLRIATTNYWKNQKKTI